MVVNKLYKLERLNYQGNTGSQGGLILKGAAVNVTILGSQTKPAAIADMVDITENGAILAAGAYAFQLLPNYLYVSGTATSVEIVNYVTEDLGELI